MIGPGSNKLSHRFHHQVFADISGCEERLAPDGLQAQI